MVKVANLYERKHLRIEGAMRLKRPTLFLTLQRLFASLPTGVLFPGISTAVDLASFTPSGFLGGDKESGVSQQVLLKAFCDMHTWARKETLNGKPFFCSLCIRLIAACDKQLYVSHWHMCSRRLTTQMFELIVVVVKSSHARTQSLRGRGLRRSRERAPTNPSLDAVSPWEDFISIATRDAVPFVVAQPTPESA